MGNPTQPGRASRAAELVHQGLKSIGEAARQFEVSWHAVRQALRAIRRREQKAEFHRQFQAESALRERVTQ